MKKNISLLTGHFKPLSDGALYPAIKRLKQKGYLEEWNENGLAGAPRRMLRITGSGRSAFISRLKAPSDLDISDRNRLFTFMAFFRYLTPSEQIPILERRLAFINGGKSFFANENGSLVRIKEENDRFRKGMMMIARETSMAERKWLMQTIAELKNLV